MKRALLALALLGGLASCGWHYGKLAAPGASSVGVEIFALEESGLLVPVRDLEADVHAELSRVVSDRVGLRLVSAAQADLVLRGKLTNYRRRNGVRSKDNELLETGVRVAVEAELVRRVDGQVLARAQSAQWSGYAIDGLGGEAAARERALHNVCERLVLELFEPLSYEAPPAQDP